MSAVVAVPDESRLRTWQVRTFWLLWTGYAAYYFCRVNFAVAQPAIKAEFHWTDLDVGLIPSTYAIFYAAGQIVNGTLGHRYGTRRMVQAALAVAALTNIGFSFVNTLPAMLALWALNGWAQSAGWSLIVQTASNWNPSARRGTVIGLLSTCYQVGNAASLLLAGVLVESIGWRAAFALPGLGLVAMAAIIRWFLVDSPEEAGFPPIRDDLAPASGTASAAAADPGTAAILRMTLLNRILWVLGIGYFCMNSVRYTFMNWAVQYMAEFQGRTIKNSAFTAVAIPLIGSVGAVSAGWASDHVFGRRRAPVCAIMLVGLAATCVAFVFVPRGEWVAATLLMAVAGFMIYGPDMLMSGAATVDASHPRAASTATGMTMALGATGSIFSGAGIGWLKDQAHGQWGLVFWVLSGLSLASAALMVSIWNARPKGAK